MKYHQENTKPCLKIVSNLVQQMSGITSIMTFETVVLEIASKLHISKVTSKRIAQVLMFLHECDLYLSGGVGMAAIQLCKTVPDVTVFGTSSAQKHDVIRQEGCTHPIDYRTQDYVQEIRKLSPKGNLKMM